MFTLQCFICLDEDLGEQPFAIDFIHHQPCQCGHWCTHDDESYELCELSDADGTIITDIGMLQAAAEYLGTVEGQRAAADAMPSEMPWALSDEYTRQACLPLTFARAAE